MARLFCLWLAIALLLVDDAKTQIFKVPASCAGLTCDNGGTMDSSGDECTCNCPNTYRGLQCETVIEATRWPEGPFATPMPKYGCPESKGSGWSTGYINMTFAEKVTNDSSLVWKAKRLTLLGPYDDHVIQLNFCFKMPSLNASNRSMVPWPPGSYGIYRAGGRCPDEFEEQRIRFALPPLLRVNTDGHIPDLLISELLKTTLLHIDVCERTSSSRNSSSDFANDFPFMLLQGSRKLDSNGNCSSFPDIASREETLELMSINMARYVGNGKAAESEVGFKLCLYKKDMKRPDESLDSYFYARHFLDIHLAAIRTAHTSRAYETLYRDYPVTRAMDVRKQFFEEGGTFHFDSAKIPLTVFLTSREMPWVLIDLEQTILVERIILLVLDLPDVQVNWTYSESPATAVSNERWAFLSNGALSCDDNMKTLLWSGPGFIHHCRRPISGRYVSVIGQDYASSPAKTASFFMTMTEFEIYGTGPGCGKDLGLRDSTIEDFQIFASSSTSEHSPGQVRPQLSGWCATLSDPDPYLQVDLLVATTVEGLKLYNWEVTKDSDMNNAYSVVSFPVGVRSFWLEYGFRADKLKAYTTPQGQKMFWVDPALPYHREQTFFLRAPIVASLVRVRPIGYKLMNDSATCMKLELVGCRKLKLKSLQCSKKNGSFWSQRTSGFISAVPYYEPASFPSAEPRHCFQICRDCDAIVYNRTSLTCSLYQTSDLERDQFRSITESKDTILYQKACLDDPVVVRPYTITFIWYSFVSLNIPEALFTNVTEEGVISSPGYPLPYDTGTIAKWFIYDFERSEILFTNISLNIYETQRDWYTDQLCEDKIVVIAFPFRRSLVVYKSKTWDTATLYQDANHTARINHTMNGRTVGYMAPSSRVEIWFHACLRETALAFRGKGFRAIIKLIVVKYVSSSTSAYECQTLPSYLLNNGFIASMSVTGSTDHRHRFEYWKLCCRHGYIILTIRYMNVWCEHNAGLETNDNVLPTRKFCNLNRPMTSIKASKTTLWIRFYYDKMSADKGIQGFEADFDSEEYSLYSEQAVITYVNGVIQLPYLGPELPESTWDFGYVGLIMSRIVCLPAVRRCYGIYPNTMFYHLLNESSSFLTARTANEKCVERMGPTARLFSMRNELEAKEIVSYVVTGLNILPVQRLVYGVDNKITMLDFCYIGLVWDTDIHGSLKARWRNGSPITYTDWSPNQPKDVAKNRCARIGIYSRHSMNTWESIDCDTLAAECYVCETDMNSTEAASDNLHRQVLNTVRVNDPHSSYRYFKCSSEEQISRLFVCDGVKDCLDGTDEVNCDCKETDVQCDKPASFQCLDGDSIPISVACNFVPDCLDGSDESCDFPACSVNEFRCNNHQCIPSSSVCNYRKDCWDGSDEIQCEICQNGTFQCGDRSCIPLGRVCDGVADCLRQLDEQNCDITSMPSCGHWWREGHRETGVFLVNNSRVLCNFSSMSSRGIIQTKYYNIQVEKNQRGQFEITYENQAFVTSLMESLQCKQSLIQTCQSPADRIDEMEAKFGLTVSRPCACIRLIWTMNTSYVEACRTGNQSGLDEQWLRNTASKLNQYGDRPLTLLEPINSGVENQWMKSEPIECEEHVHTGDEKLLCGSGRAVSEATRCLYAVTEFGEVVGCRDLSHLQNCDDSTCPDGFSKCDNSYCVATSLLCDGEWQCPDGQDERFCWCGANGNPVTIMYDADAGLQYAASRLAKQLYEHSDSMVSSNVELVRYWPSARDQVEEGTLNPVVAAEIDYTHYNPRKINQFSEKNRSTVLQAAELIPSVLALTEQRPATLVLFQNDMSHVQLTADKLMAFDHSILRQIQTYVVSIGGESTFTGSVYRRDFPVNTSFVHFKTSDVVVPFHVGHTACPDLLPDLSPVCPGMYRCHASRQCIAITGVCNGFRQCPLGDDEKPCDFSCPENCLCSGFEVDCRFNRTSEVTLSSLSTNTRNLDLHSSDFQTLEFNASNLPFLIALDMSRCFITSIPTLFLESMRNLLYLDLSFNKITTLKAADFLNKIRLLSLDLAENTDLQVIDPMSFRHLVGLRSLKIRHSNLHTLAAHTFNNLNVSHLDLSENRISIIENKAFDGATINSLDISKNPIDTFQSGLFEGISNLQTLRSGAYKFCCIRPDSVKEEDCYPPMDEFSSCADLMRNEVLRFFLWIIGICALIGNIFSLLYRIHFDRKRLKLGYGVFVTNLAVSDLLMGLYLLMIAATDVIYRGRYIEVDDWWRNSAWCGLAGVLATMSSEGSILFMCLITLDRFIVIKYPFSEVRFSTKKALIAAGICWAFVANVATIPLWLTSYFDNQFYSRSAVCLALPLTRRRPPGWAYSSTVFIGFNFVVFLIIACGQFLIYQEVQASSKRMKNTKSRKTNDLVVARNLLFIVATDFLCWFPIGVMGMMALSDHVVSSEVYAWAAVLILPVNSALNPFLYTFSAIIGNKKSAPRTSNKVATNLYSKVTVDCILNLWGKKLLCQRSANRYGYRLLSEHLSQLSLTPNEILRVSLRLGQAIHQLHAVDLVLGNLSPEYIMIGRRKNKVRDAVLKISPSMASRATEKRLDIEGFGHIVSTVLTRLGKTK